MSGATRPVSSAMSPMRRAPISRTRNRVAASARSMVSGTPSSLLSELDRGDRRRGARQHGRQQVLGAGLALGAGQPDDGQPVAQPGHDVGGERL